MYSAYQKFEALLHKVESFFVVFPFFLIFVTVVQQVFQRYFNLPGEETSEIL
jgi:TRAP-type C4-dicarboxylate transport system permease small subunit